MMRLAGLFALLVIGLADPGLAFEPEMPPLARQLSERIHAPARYDLPVSPYRSGALDTVVINGTVRQTTWVISQGGTTLQVMEDLSSQLPDQGFAPVFNCEDKGCGGFDFRFAIDVVPAPDMYVNIGDFAFLAAMNGTGDAISLLVSAGRGETYVQIVSAIREPDETPIDLGTALVETGRVVLNGLGFQNGTTLDPGPAAALDALADFLTDNPDARIAIIAHSDEPADGDTSRALGLAQARAVRARLISGSGLDPHRVEAMWLGPYTPRASPITETGRALNRRIEAVLLPADTPSE